VVRSTEQGSAAGRLELEWRSAHLACGERDSILEGEVVKAARDAPVTEAVEENLPTAGRLVEMDLVQEVDLRMRPLLVSQSIQVGSQ
jgi:hypothetical protein